MIAYLTHIGLLAGGIVILLVASEFLVKGSVNLANRLGLQPLVIGLTIVAFGTSLPEMFVSAEAVLSGSSGIALGNIIGSNVANILLVLGAAAVVYPLSCRLPGLISSTVIMMLATAVFAGILYWQGEIGLVAGIFLAVMIVTYVLYIARRVTSGAELDSFAEELLEVEEGAQGLPMILLWLAIGLIGLPVGASVVIENGAWIARSMNVRDEIIGLSIIAIGTSLPELVTVVASALRKQSELALGNVLGSNIFNLLAVGGVVGIFGGADVSTIEQALDVPVMICVSVLLAALIFLRWKMGRIIGPIFLIGYGVYIWTLGHVAGLL